MTQGAVDGRAGPQIASVRATAAYELVVEQLRKAIFLGRFVPGDKLPPERDLASQMLVSRTTVREAIRVLEGEGLVAVKRGAAGGLTVLAQDRLSPSEGRVYIEAQLDILDSLFDYRIANEAAAAAFAATRRTPAQLERLRRALQTMDTVCATSESRAVTSNIALFNSADSEFHLVIAEASMNPYFVRAAEESRAAMFLPVGKVFTRLEDRANEHHRAIFNAIEAQQPGLAAEGMKLHIEATRMSLHDLLPTSARRS